jgi:putative transcriptional regulator
MSDARTSALGREIVSGLKEFKEALADKSVMTRMTCRRVILELKPQPYDPNTVKETRQVLGVSQALFAQFLGVSRGTVRGWEQGTKPPSPQSCRFMDEIRFNPEYWRKRLADVAVSKEPAT